MNRPGPYVGCNATEQREVDDFSNSPNNTLYHSYTKIQNTEFLQAKRRRRAINM